MIIAQWEVVTRKAACGHRSRKGTETWKRT